MDPQDGNRFYVPAKGTKNYSAGVLRGEAYKATNEYTAGAQRTINTTKVLAMPLHIATFGVFFWDRGGSSSSSGDSDSSSSISNSTETMFAAPECHDYRQSHKDKDCHDHDHKGKDDKDDCDDDDNDHHHKDDLQLPRPPCSTRFKQPSTS